MKIIELSKGYVTKVDDEDYEVLMQIKWNVTNPAANKYYAISTTALDGRNNAFMHRFILRLRGKDVWVDHIDGDGLNNQKHNLRICDKIENAYNMEKALERKGVKCTSKFKGVSFIMRDQRWKVCIAAKKSILDKKDNRVFVGYFDDEISAAIAYNHAAREHHGEFAKFNSILGWENIFPQKSKPSKEKSSKYKGVSKTRNEKWRAGIKHKYQELHLGTFETEEAAAKAYNQKAIELFGDKAKLNIIK